MLKSIIQSKHLILWGLSIGSHIYYLSDQTQPHMSWNADLRELIPNKKLTLCLEIATIQRYLSGESRVRLAHQMNTKRRRRQQDDRVHTERKDALVIASPPFVSHKGLQTPVAYEWARITITYSPLAHTHISPSDTVEMRLLQRSQALWLNFDAPLPTEWILKRQWDQWVH